MNEFLDYFKQKKNLVSLFFLMVVVLGLPLGITLLQRQQNIKSRANVDPIVFSGNVEQRNGNWVATKSQVSLELTSPLGPPEGENSSTPGNDTLPSSPPSSGASPTLAPTVAPTVVPTISPTVAPTIAPTAVPTFPPPVPWPSNKSKLGIQTAWQKPGIMDFIAAAQPRIVKLLGDYGRATLIKQKSPNTFIVGRIYEADQPTAGSPQVLAQAWFDRNKNTLLSANIDCWEGYNEPNPNLLNWLSDFEIKRMQLLEGIGKKACIGSFAVGNPRLEQWPEFMPAINYGTSKGHFLSLHEYGPNRMDTDFIWYAGRHRQVYNQYGLTIPLIISETGIDTAKGASGGWRSVTNANDYLNQLKWYDSQLQQDSYVKGTAIFSYGLYGWESFEISPDLTGLDGASGPLTLYIKGS